MSLQYLLPISVFFFQYNHIFLTTNGLRKQSSLLTPREFIKMHLHVYLLGAKNVSISSLEMLSFGTTIHCIGAPPLQLNNQDNQICKISVGEQAIFEFEYLSCISCSALVNSTKSFFAIIHLYAYCL